MVVDTALTVEELLGKPVVPPLEPWHFDRAVRDRTVRALDRLVEEPVRIQGWQQQELELHTDWEPTHKAFVRTEVLPVGPAHHPNYLHPIDQLPHRAHRSSFLEL